MAAWLSWARKPTRPRTRSPSMVNFSLRRSVSSTWRCTNRAGVILLTNDGDLTDRLTHPRYESAKEYRVLVKGHPDEERLEAWRRGVVLDGKRTAPAKVRREARTEPGTWLRVIMHEGRKHEIRD